MADRQVEVRVPKWGLTMTEVVVSAWLIEVGDTVGAGDPICTVETVKIDSDLEAPADGVLQEIKVHAGSSAKVGEVVAIFTCPD